ncbi:MAG TPA: iron-containing alcohol dehydrogenase [Candidatus Methylomirabilis sp.]|nr:iron-containing alcohol dehydrogenase [Candidatus Methylomirabilis sp.]
MPHAPWQFRHPTKLIFGVDSLGQLGEEARRLARRALLVTYRDRTGLEEVIARVREELRRAELDIADFPEIEPDPLESTGRRGAEVAKAERIDLVVGVGGGSAMDAAKGIAALVTSGGTPWEYSRCNPERRPIKASLPIIAIPTTAGTGSEMTSTAVFSHPERDLKAAIVDPALFPIVALVDPRLMIGAPPKLTAYCGMDALGQCVEAYLSRTTNPISQSVAVQGFQRIWSHLPTAVSNGSHLEARTDVALGTTLSGIAISHGGTYAAHSMSHALGALLHLHHGLGVGICTVPVLRHCAETHAGLISSFATAVGLGAVGQDHRAAADTFIARVDAFLRQIGLPDKVSVERGDGPASLAERLTENAFRSTPAAINNTPREMTRDAMKRMFLELLTRERSHN